MNIFAKETDIVGKHSHEKMQNSINLFYETVKKIKKKLGGSNYKLDEYLNLLFKGIVSKPTEDAAMDGASAYSSLRGICTSILYNETRCQDHEFYQTSKDFILSHELPYKEIHTQHELYCALLTPKFADFVAKKYAKELKRRVSSALDIVALQQSYENLEKAVGNYDMEKLNDLIKKVFIDFHVMKAFLRSFSDEYIFCLLYRDPETSKQIFQLLPEISSIEN